MGSGLLAGCSAATDIEKQNKTAAAVTLKDFTTHPLCRFIHP